MVPSERTESEFGLAARQPSNAEVDNLKRRGRHMLLSLAGLAAPMVGAVFAIPILLDRLSPAAFGLFGLFWVIIGYSSLLELGLGRATTRSIAAESNSQIAVREIIGTSAILGLVFGITAAVGMWLLLPNVFGRFVPIPVELYDENRRSLWIIAASTPLLIATSIMIGVLEGLQRFGQIALARVPSGFCFFGVPAVLALLGATLDLMVLSIIIVRGLFAIYLAWSIYRAVPGLFAGFRLVAHRMKDLMSFGGWIAVSAVVGPLLVYLDRFILSNNAGLEAAAIYTPPFEAVIRFLIIPSAVVGVFFPRFVTAKAVGNERQLFVEANVVIGGLLLFVGAVFVFGGEQIFRLWLSYTEVSDNEISLMAVIASVLCAGLLINGLAHVPQSLIQARGNARWTAILHVVELVLFLVYAPILVSRFAEVGAATSWLVRATVSAIALYSMAALMMQRSRSD